MSWNSSTKKCVNRLCSSAALLVIADEITRLDEEIEEIEAAGLRLQNLVVRDRPLQRLMEERGEIGFARGDERSRSARTPSRRASTSSRAGRRTWSSAIPCVPIL